MLHPKHNRIDYGDQLIPPAGYELTYAVGSTYSLDLEALMILPVALFYSQKLDSTTDELRYDMLDAITKSAEKISVYFQNGQLKVPQKYHHLMAYWEEGIQPVNMPNHVSSFHPKVWVIRYESVDLPPKYRVLVTSRNLTFARDWDMAFATDGEYTEKEQPKNAPLLHFLQFLNSSGKKKIPEYFLSDLLNIKFDLPEKFDSFRFVPVGIPNVDTSKTYINPLTAPRAKWEEILIVSPFLDKTTLDKLHHATSKTPYLLSRKEEMDGVPIETLANFNSWQFSTFFQKAEYYQELEDAGDLPVSQNLHAKFFVAMQNGTPYWYLGSANCSDPAQERNVEFMIELKGGNWSGLKSKDVFRLFSEPSKMDNITLFTQYDVGSRTSVEEQRRIELDIRKIKYDLTCLPINGYAILMNGGSAYDLNIEINASSLTLPARYEVLVKPLPEKQKASYALSAGKANIIEHFGGYAETALSIFLIFSIKKDDVIYSEFLLPMKIDLPATRLKKIFTSIIDSREKFLKYLTFLLTGEEIAIIGGNKEKVERTSDSQEAKHFSGSPVFEKLLLAASRTPKKLQSIDKLIQNLKSETAETDTLIITPEFEGFWNVFQTFIKNNNR